METVIMMAVLVLAVAVPKVKPIHGGVVPCEFHDYLSSCHLIIGGRFPSQITATINHCNDPVDVSISVMSDVHRISWSHTFGNHHESQEVNGFRRNVRLNVFLYQEKQKHSVDIKAVFDIDEVSDPFFLNSTVHISKATSCGILNGAAGLTTLVIFIVIILCLFIVVPSIIWYKRRQHIRMRNALVEHMEPPGRTPPSSIEMRPTPLGAIEENIPGEQAEHEEDPSSGGSVPSASTRDVIGQEHSLELSNDLSNGTHVNTMSNGYV
ncbi:uncharacterized protein LOC135495156 [Lineus longissimus]|uniref:uncharacterized protein LOC135495156 n=1 Tax=Lineus longissimus TaxID=88925 RepID=UPI002B4ED260